MTFDVVEFLKTLTPVEAVTIARRLAPQSPHLAAWLELIDKHPTGKSYLSAGRRSDDADPAAKRKPGQAKSGRLIEPVRLVDDFPVVVVREMARLGVDPDGGALSAKAKLDLAAVDRRTFSIMALGSSSGSRL